MGRRLGIGIQLVLGLGFLFVIVIISVGAITLWASRNQNAGQRVEEIRILAASSARSLAFAMSKKVSAPQLLLLELERLGPVALYDRRGDKLAGKLPAYAKKHKLLQRVSLTQQQQMALVFNEKKRAFWLVLSPIFSQGVFVGTLFQVLNPEARDSLPALYWWLMVADGVVILLFVYLMIKRTTLKPLVSLERAAAYVAEGNFDVKVENNGAKELVSLANSFNSMTVSLALQLERLEEQRQSLIRSEKLASIGRLAAGIAHEVGNPLQAIIGFSDLLINRNPDEDRRIDSLKRIQSEAERIHLIISQLLDYSRPAKEEAEAVSIADVLKRSIALVRPQKRFKMIDIIIEPTIDELVLVSAHTQRLMQVFVNLAMNASDAMDGEGKLKISAASFKDHIEIYFSNDGPVIDPKTAEKIFEPFYTTKDPGKGTGLGLAVSRSIVESFGGELRLDQKAKQTTFKIKLNNWCQDN